MLRSLILEALVQQTFGGKRNRHVAIPRVDAAHALIAFRRLQVAAYQTLKKGLILAEHRRELSTYEVSLDCIPAEEQIFAFANPDAVQRNIRGATKPVSLTHR